MRWQTGRRSTNVEDRRGIGGRGIAGIGGGGLIILALIAILTGTNPLELLQQVAPNSELVNPSGTTQELSAEEQELADFSSVVLADTEDTWAALFEQMDRTYQVPGMVLYTGYVQSACGFAQAAVGPFYCPGDRKLYIDLSFYRDLQTRFKAPGEFAQAYVIAHEVGHHIQNLLGISAKVQGMQGRAGEAQANALSVRMELQADCFAGIWANHANRTRQILEAGDIEAGLNAASAIGDDRLQMQSRGYVSPESFTHGSSEQRVRWFKRGMDSGSPKDCDTFATSAL